MSESPLQSIEKLRADVDFTPYETSPDCPLWIQQLSMNAHKDLGVLGLLGPSGLSIATSDNRRIRPKLDQPSLYLSGLTDFLRRSGRHFAVGVPAAARHLPLLLASSAVLANTLERAIGKTRSGILVISPDLDLRSRYCDIFVQKEPLDAAFPGSRLRPNGEQIMLKPKVMPTDEGVCFFLPGLVLPDKVKICPDLIILDLRFGRWIQRTADLCNWVTKLWKTAGVIGLYTVGDRDTLNILSAAGFNDFPLDHRAIASCIGKAKKDVTYSSEYVVDWRMGNAVNYLDRTHEIHLISSSKLEELFHKIGELIDQHKEKVSPTLKRIKWLFATMAQLPVPVRWYNETASNRGRFTLLRLIERLVPRGQIDDGFGAVIQSFKLLFTEVLSELEKENPRSIVLKSILTKFGSDESTVIIQVLARDRISSQALATWLAVEVFADEPWLPKLQIQACANYSRELPGKTLTIVNGAFPRRYKWLAGADLGNSVHFLSYSHEIEIIERQLKSIYDSDACDERRRNRERSLGVALSCGLSKDNLSECFVSPLTLKAPTRSAKKCQPGAIIKSGGLSDLGALLEASKKSKEKAQITEESNWTQDTEEDEVFENGDFTSSDIDSAKSCILLRIRSRSEGTGSILIPKHSAIDCVRISVDEELRRLTADQIIAGDVILLLGDSKRAGIFETIVDLAERQPFMEYLGAFRRRWNIAVQALAAKYRIRYGIDYYRILRDLKNEGATVDSEAAVRLWVQGIIIGPETAQSIRAVGIVSGNNTVAVQAKEFQAAFRKIRGLRRGIGNRLSNVIRSSFKHLAIGDSPPKTEELDERLGIPFDELLETIDMAEVMAVIKAPEDCSNMQIGRFKKN